MNILRATGMAVFLSVLSTVHAASINVSLLDSYETSLFNSAASEITAYSPVSGYFFVTSSATNKIDVLQLDGNNNVTKFSDIALPGGGPNSVAVYGNVVAVAVQAGVKTDNGTVEFYDATTLAHLNTLIVGALPDMLTFTPDGSRLLVANEAEPNDAYTIDPVGTVSIIDMTDGVASLDAGDVATVSFASLTLGDLDSSTRVFGPGASVAQDFEPEYIAVDPDGTTAYVTLQENNALAIIDIASASLINVVGLGFKDHSLAGNFMDSSDRDPNGAPLPNIISRPVLGMYQPDAIASFKVDGQTYLITANEGDTRGWTGFNEEARVSTLDLDDTIFPTEVALKNNNSLGRLTVTNTKGKLDEDADNAFEKLYVFGTRSFSIWNSSGTQVYDSGDDIEQTVLAQDPTRFNVSHDNNNLEDRSDNKGPEPEAATVAKIGGKTYAFIGLERQSAILVYDVSIPAAPVFEQYLSNRNFAQVPAAGQGGDLGPEGILFVPASQSPNGNNLLVVSNEVSGSTTFYNINVRVKNDFGGDGKSDVLMRNKNTGEWYMAELDGTSILGQSIVSGPFLNVNHKIVSTGDLDGDGDADILTRGTVSSLVPGRFRVELTNGRVHQGNAWMNTMSSSLNDQIVSTKDFNDDGKADVLLRNSSTGVWTLNLMNGTGAPAIGTLNATTDLAYTFKGDGDYDGNGYPDLLLRQDNGGDGSWMVVTLDGDFTIAQSGAPGLAASSIWQALVTDKDFNGDGKTDVLLRDNDGSVQQWFIYLMNGTSAPSDSGLVNMATSDQWQIASDADFDADGKADIMLRSTLTGQWYGYLLDGKTINSSSLLAMILIKDWELKTIDDHNGDGKGDILLRDKISGQWLMHLMDGLTVQQRTVLPVLYSLDYELQNQN